MSSNFLSRETYTDLLISTHFSVMMICFYRDNFPTEKCLLQRTGSGCCEEFFSKNGQFVGNHHVYPYGQMFQNVGHMMSQIEADDNAASFAKAHVKQENVWHRQTQGGVTCSLMDYPAHGEEEMAWKQGIERARELARNLGMRPGFFSHDNGDDDDPDDPDNGWFYRPFQHGDHDKLFRDTSRDSAPHGPDAPGDDMSDSPENPEGKYSFINVRLNCV